MAARKRRETLENVLRECEDWERQVRLPKAQERIELDLDDGVKVNYLKLGGALATMSGLAGPEEGDLVGQRRGELSLAGKDTEVRRWRGLKL